MKSDSSEAEQSSLIICPVWAVYSTDIIHNSSTIKTTHLTVCMAFLYRFLPLSSCHVAWSHVMLCHRGLLSGKPLEWKALDEKNKTLSRDARSRKSKLISVTLKNDYISFQQEALLLHLWASGSLRFWQRWSNRITLVPDITERTASCNFHKHITEHSSHPLGSRSSGSDQQRKGEAGTFITFAKY